MNWLAKWIWDNSGKNPENHRACFRHTFILTEKFDDAVLHITADSRYTVSINGRRIGSGPVRNWTAELPYDSYPVNDYLVPGANSIAVLVNHYGISSFQYIEGRGGLLAQLDFYNNGKISASIGTDSSWKTAIHSGYKKTAPMVNIRLSWGEVYDANLFDKNWICTDFTDSSWDSAAVIGETGMEPWGIPVQRDIPFLTDEPVYPKKILYKNIVKPIGQTLSIDLRRCLYGSANDANRRVFYAFLTSEIEAPYSMDGRIILFMCPHTEFWGHIRLGSQNFEYRDGPVYNVHLEKGRNRLFADISGLYRDTAVYLGFDFPENLNVRDWAVVGPFGIKAGSRCGVRCDNKLPLTPEYLGLRDSTEIPEKADFIKWAKPVPQEYLFTDNAYIDSVFRTLVRSQSAAGDTHNMCMANNSFTSVVPDSGGDWEFLLDLGQEQSGYLEFDIDFPPAAVLDFYMFESMHDGFIEHPQGTNNVMRYITRTGRQFYRSKLRRGGRFIQFTVHNLSAPAKVYSIHFCQSNYPVAETGSFRCSDALLNRIWEISRHTTRLCMEDTFVDCPLFEQTFWVGDSRNEALIDYYLFGAYGIVKHSLKLAAGSLRHSPLIESHVPSGWRSIIPDWSFLWVTACREYYEITGDREFLNEIYPAMIATADNTEQFMNADGLFEIEAWNMLDWAPMDTPDTGVITHQNAFLVRALNDTAYAAAILGKTDDEKRLLERSAGLCKAINLHLWNENLQAYADSRHADGKLSGVVGLQTNLAVHLCGCAAGSRKQIVEKYLVNPPDNFLKIYSPFVNFFYYETLIKQNSLNTVLDDMRKVWGRMLEYDATTCWECATRWEGFFFLPGYLTRSHCHAWSAAPAYFLGAYILGVRPLEPGCAKIIIEPQMCGLSWISGSVPVPQGRIDVSVKYVKNVLTADISVPAGVKAELHMPKDCVVNLKQGTL
ncbi:MAG: alpha-L-rhamnosidase N-terminal domain-containing protein [Treponema sp.]|nr:alpha-L-rhamnosidase N-terminal domain-containing protein [Treponema sp.]